MLITLIPQFIFANSAAFETLKVYCQSNEQILKKTGKINHFGTLISGSISSDKDNGTATFYFKAMADQGNFYVKAELVKDSGEWLVDYVNLK